MNSTSESRLFITAAGETFFLGEELESKEAGLKDNERHATALYVLYWNRDRNMDAIPGNPILFHQGFFELPGAESDETTVKWSFELKGFFASFVELGLRLIQRLDDLTRINTSYVCGLYFDVTVRPIHPSHSPCLRVRLRHPRVSARFCFRLGGPERSIFGLKSLPCRVGVGYLSDLGQFFSFRAHNWTALDMMPRSIEARVQADLFFQQ